MHIIGVDNREWVIRRDILWEGKDYGFEVETTSRVENLVISTIIILLFLLIIFSAPVGIPVWFYCVLFLLSMLPGVLWALNRPRKIIAICGLEEWTIVVRGWGNGRLIIRDVINSIRHDGLPYELERIH